MKPPTIRPRSWTPGPRRTKYERWVELLEACVWESRTQSWLMRHLGLKTQMIKEDLQFLLDADLFEQVDEPEAGIYVFKTTEKGREALDQFYTLVTLFFTSGHESMKHAAFLIMC
ncbi:MAG: winged helix-turn-helix domain-containing protein [Candidatus Thorarchaeota archaeon]